MFNSNIILTFDYQNEHVFEHDLVVKTNFSTPKIYTANGDLKKRWYVYFSFRNPQNGKLQRMKNIYGKANNYKTKEDRMLVLSAYRRNLLKLLKEGFNPFEDNTGLLQRRSEEKTAKAQEQKVKKNEVHKADVSTSQQKAVMSVKEAFDFALSIKQKTVGMRTYKDYEHKVKKFLNWLEKHYPDIKAIDELNKNNLQQYLNELLQNTSARNRNNYRVDLSSLMQVMVDNEIVSTNYFKSIKILKATPERNKTYTDEIQADIFNYLEENDLLLLLFIKFISYNFMRPIEVCRIKIGDINLNDKTITFKAKNKPTKIKIIPDILIKELPDLTKLNSDDYLFTPTKIGGQWDTAETNKRDYFTKRFKKVVKDTFSLGKDYGLYSFRHTFITKLYRELRKKLTPFEAKSKLKLITGHTTMTALEKYLRDIDAELPEDYSELLKVK